MAGVVSQDASGFARIGGRMSREQEDEQEWEQEY